MMMMMMMILFVVVMVISYFHDIDGTDSRASNGGHNNCDDVGGNYDSHADADGYDVCSGGSNGEVPGVRNDYSLLFMKSATPRQNGPKTSKPGRCVDQCTTNN